MKTLFPLQKEKPSQIKIIRSLETKYFQPVPTSILEKQEHFEYCNGFELDSSLMQQVKPNIKQFHPDFLENLMQQVGLASEGVYDNAFRDDFANDIGLYYYNSRVGYGVFYLKQGGVIKKGTCIGFYAGEIADINVVNSNLYAAPVGSPNSLGVQPCIDAMHRGNWTRFINDFPSEKDLKQYQFALGDVDHRIVCTANLDRHLFSIASLPFVFLIANRDIRYGEQLGYKYSNKYWLDYYREHRQDRLLFNRSGELTPSFMYRRKNPIIRYSFEGCDHVMHRKEDDISTLRELARRAEDLSPFFGREIIHEVSFPDGSCKEQIISLDDFYRSLSQSGYSVSDYGQFFLRSTTPFSSDHESSQLRVLRHFVHPNFYLAWQEDAYFDAVLDIAEEERAEVLKKLGNIGLYPKIESNRITILNVNEKMSLDMIIRLRDKNLSFEGRNVYSRGDVSGIKGLLSHQDRIVVHDDGGNPIYQISPEELSFSLAQAGYPSCECEQFFKRSVSPNLFNRSNCIQSESTQARVLRDFVHPNFQFVQQSNYSIDAILDLAREKQENILNKLSGVGLYPTVKSATIKIFNINDAIVARSIMRLKDKNLPLLREESSCLFVTPK